MIKIIRKTPTLLEHLRMVGSRIKGFWTAKEVGKTGWKQGWYIGRLKSFDYGTDTIVVEFDTEPGKEYRYNVESEVKCGKLRAARELSVKLS
jgi:hypothetical protein